MTFPEPVVGWRIWRLASGLLESIAMDHRWRPGENVAVCLSCGSTTCAEPPGRHCQCGFWALWSPRKSVDRAKPAIEPPWQVLGLVAGWGRVALHGSEGFRAERASVLCLFSDHPWPWTPSLLAGATSVWRRALSRAGRAVPPDEPPNRRRDDIVRSVAAHYAVPLLSLQDAVDRGFLGELGIPEQRIAEAAQLTAGAWWSTGKPGTC